MTSGAITSRTKQVDGRVAGVADRPSDHAIAGRHLDDHVVAMRHDGVAEVEGPIEGHHAAARRDRLDRHPASVSQPTPGWNRF